MFFGFALMIWIFVQVSMIGGGNWLQYLYFVLGVLQLLFGVLLRDALRGLKVATGPRACQAYDNEVPDQGTERRDGRREAFGRSSSSGIASPPVP
jgi:hypothetical protein